MQQLPGQIGEQNRMMIHGISRSSDSPCSVGGRRRARGETGKPGCSVVSE